VVGLFVMALAAPEASGPLGSATVAGSSGSRAFLWQDALTLIGDYRFTGSGYRSTMMVLSTYVYLLHVGFIPHVHNLYLEIAVEQGMVGLIAFLFLAGTAGWNLLQAYRLHSLPRGLVGAATAALVALLMHGLVDAGLYVSKLAPLLFLPMGFAWAMAPRVRRPAPFTWERFAQRTAVALAPLLVVLVLFAWPGARAAFQANLGAVSQTRAELARYAWPDWPIQDALRRDPGVDLGPAIARFAAALTYDSGNITANRRLGQIALARGDYDQARYFLEEAYARAPQERATRLLLGEIYAISGRLDDAATLWRSVDTSFGQLDGREWWLTEVGTPEQIEHFREARKRLVPG
jgi:O-antigen ligase